MKTEVIKVSTKVETGQKDAEGNDILKTLTGEGNYDFPETLDEAIEAYGSDSVFALMTAKLRVDVMALYRNAVIAGKDLSILSSWKPGQRAPQEDPTATLMRKFKDPNTTVEEKARLLAEFRAAAGL